MGAVLETSVHIIEQQWKAEQGFVAEYRDGMYDFKNPYIVVNPYLICPLSAVIMFKTQQETAITATVRGKNEEVDFHFNFEKAIEHTLSVVGLYAATENIVELQNDSGEITVLKISTGEAPQHMQKAHVELYGIEMKDQLFFAVPTTNAYLMAGYDVNGDCRWYSTEPLSYHFNRTKNGHIFVGGPYVLTPPYSTTTLLEISLDGKIYKEYRLPKGYQEAYFEKSDGNLLMMTQKSALETVDDLIYLLDRDSGEIRKQWDMKEILPQDVGESGSQDGRDWFHGNSLWYDEQTNSITVCGSHQDIIVNINEKTGIINWMLGDPERWPKEYVDKYFLRPNGIVEWAYEPHGIQFIEKNKIICFDSGHYRAKKKDEYVSARDNYSRGVIYKINIENKMVTQEWQYGKEFSSKGYSPYMGNIVIYGKNHFAIHAGGSATVDGQAVDLPGIFQKRIEEKTVLYSTTNEVKNGELIAKIVLEGNYYQVQHLKVNEGNTMLGKGKYVGQWGKDEEFLLDMPANYCGMVPQEYKLTFHYDGERLIMRGEFKKGDVVMLYLLGNKEKHQFFVQCTRSPLGTMCLFTYDNSSARHVIWPIYIGDFKDCYKIMILINDKLYKTNLSLDLREENREYV